MTAGWVVPPQPSPVVPVARAYPWKITGAWTVFAVWGLVAAVAAVQRRDV